MPQPRPAAATESRKAVCLCCRKRLHPTTVWRHAQVAATAEAFQEAGSSRIPPSYPRASFVLSSRRLVPPSGEDVSGLAQSMEAAHLSEHGMSEALHSIITELIATTAQIKDLKMTTSTRDPRMPPPTTRTTTPTTRTTRMTAARSATSLTVCRAAAFVYPSTDHPPIYR